MIDSITLWTVVIFVFSIAVFAIFAKFTMNLMRQHNDINMLLYAIEEEEKKKQG